MSERPISAARVARDLLGKSPGWFYAHRPELEAAGFPKPLPVLHSYSPSAVRAWIDRPTEGTANNGLTLEGLAGKWEKSA